MPTASGHTTAIRAARVIGTDVVTSQGEKVGHTAWNNRLAALAGKGVVVETQHGRAKRYRPLLPGM